MTKEEIKHINWMYNRLTSVHKENPNTDYMIRFKEIIDKQLTLCGVVKCACEHHKPATKWKGDELLWTCEICKRPC